MTYEKKQAFEADSEKIEALQQPGQFPELVATDESLVALYNEQHGSYGQSLTPLQAEDRAMDDETNWTTLRTFFRRAQRLVSERLTVIVSLVSTVFALLHERLDGNDEYGIPAIPFGSTASPAVAETLGTLPAAVRLLRSRKITNGATDTAIPDGCSLARLLCDSSLASEVTEIVDDNEYVLDKSLNCYEPLYPNLQRIVIGATENSQPIFYVYGYNTGLTQMTSLLTIELPNLVTARPLIHPNAGTSASFHPGFPNVTTLSLPKVESIETISGWQYYQQAFIGRSLPSLETLSMPELVTMNTYLFGGNTLPNIKSIRLPKLKYCNYNFQNSYIGSNGCPNLILLEVGAVQTNMNISFWSPTMALRTDTDASDYVDLREDTSLSNNLAQFLTNFRSVLFTRLAQRTSTTSLTLTLSPEVYKAVYGLDADYNVDPDALAQTASLADFGITTEDLNEIEIAAGITTATKYATWLDTYRGAIYWNIGHS